MSKSWSYRGLLGVQREAELNREKYMLRKLMNRSVERFVKTTRQKNQPAKLQPVQTKYYKIPRLERKPSAPSVRTETQTIKVSGSFKLGKQVKSPDSDHRLWKVLAEIDRKFMMQR